jgi:hypothetical protein
MLLTPSLNGTMKKRKEKKIFVHRYEIDSCEKILSEMLAFVKRRTLLNKELIFL